MELSWLKNYNLLIFDRIDSTNSEAIRLARAGIQGNFVIWSNNQTNGRGQRSRHWESLEGNLHMSFLLDYGEEKKAQRQSQLSFVAANALYETIEVFALKQKLELEIALKWPNDLLINHKKVAGILLESININGRQYIIVGIGVNILYSPENLRGLTTSLAEEGLNIHSLDGFLDELVTIFDRLLTKWQRSGNFTEVRKAWLNKAYNLNKVITVDNGSQRMSGIFKSINLDGSIMLELANGEIYCFSSGEIITDD